MVSLREPNNDYPTASCALVRSGYTPPPRQPLEQLLQLDFASQSIFYFEKKAPRFVLLPSLTAVVSQTCDPEFERGEVLMLGGEDKRHGDERLGEKRGSRSVEVSARLPAHGSTIVTTHK